jgi:RimJ/RimL family protein N-acetyltransferase
MKLEAKRVYLKPLCLEDANGNYPSWLNDKEVCRYNSHGEVLYTKEMAVEYIKSVQNSSTCRVFAVCLNSGKHIGNISLQDIKDSSAEFAILMGEKEFWGKGYAREAGEVLLRYGFEVLNLKSVYCGTSLSNIAMQKLAKALGMEDASRESCEVLRYKIKRESIEKM